LFSWSRSDSDRRAFGGEEQQGTFKFKLSLPCPYENVEHMTFSMEFMGFCGGRVGGLFPVADDFISRIRFRKGITHARTSDDRREFLEL